MMGGLLVAARGGAPLVKRYGPRPVIVAGLVVLAGSAFLGSTTGTGDGYGSVAVWLSLSGVGFGLAIVPAMEAALGQLPVDRAGSGSGLLQTLRQTGSAVGVAILGSVLAAGYTGRLSTDALPPAAAHAARSSVIAAHALADPALSTSADAAYIHGMDLTLLVCGGAALAAAVLVGLFLPNPHGVAPAGVGTDTADPSPLRPSPDHPPVTG